MNTNHFEELYPEDSCFKPIEKIISYIKEGNSIQIAGLPGVGKSNLLKLLIYNYKVREKHLGSNQKYFHFVLLNFAEMRNKPLIEVIKFIFLTLNYSLKERGLEKQYQKSNELLKESLTYNDELILFQGLKKSIENLALEDKYTIVLLFDRFEEYLPSLKSEFFTNLRILRDLAKYRFSVIFALNRPLEEVVDVNILSDFYEFIAGHTIFLPFYDKGMQDFRIEYLEKATGKKIKKEILEEILRLTGRHSKLTRVCLETVLDKELLSSQNLTEILLSQKNIEGVLLEIWYALTPAEQQHLINTEGGKAPEDTHIYLEESGLVKDTKLQIPILGQYIKSSLNKLSNDDYIYDPATKQITRGNQNISELLTKSEFKLLKLLLEKNGLVVDREEIVSKIWGENKSTAGVTDQAIDQLIFRLRKKIEEDVSNPKYIITVKGRGVRFAA